MKNFKTLDQAKKDLQVYQNYIHLIESYFPSSLLEHTIHQYALIGNIHRTAKALNDLGHQLDGVEITGKDVTKIISSKPAFDDPLHKEIYKLYSKKTSHRKRYR